MINWPASLSLGDDILLLSGFHLIYSSTYLSPPNTLPPTPSSRDILLVGNPLYEGVDPAEARLNVIRRLPNIQKIDGVMVTGAERSAAK